MYGLIALECLWGKTFFNEIEKILISERDSAKMKTYVNGKNGKGSRGEKRTKYRCWNYRKLES